MTRHPLLLVLLLAAACCLPGLGLPWMMDDWFHHGALRHHFGEPAATTPDIFAGWRHPGGLPALFSFFEDPALTREAIAGGVLPWWTDPELHIRFLRPLSSLSHLLDFLVFGTDPLGAHLHSAAWYLALVAVVWRVYQPLARAAREVGDAAHAGSDGLAAAPVLLALVPAAMFAVDEGHWYAVGWVAGRNALISATLGLLGLLAHRRWVEAGWRGGLPLSLGLYALALAGGEAALGVLGLAACYQLLGAPGPLRRRLVQLVPLGLLVLAWALLYALAGFGARHSGLYIDPAGEPLLYLSRALVRGPVLLGGLVLGLPVDLYFFQGATRGALVAGGFLAVALLAWGLRRAWPHLPVGVRRELRWLVPGGLLALLPVLATFPLARLLLVPSVGIFPALAAILLVARLRGARLLAGLVALVHLVLPPLGWWGMDALSYDIEQQFVEMLARPPLDDPRPALVLPVADPALAIYMPVEAAVTGRVFPRPWQLSSVTGGAHVLTRTGPRQLTLRATERPMGEAIFERLFRDFEAAPVAVDTRVVGPLATVRVLEAEQGLPTVLELTLHADQAEALRLLRWSEGGFVELPLPELGEEVLLPHVVGPMGL